MAVLARHILLLLLSLSPLFQLSHSSHCGVGLFCPAPDDCSRNPSLCRRGECPANVSLSANCEDEGSYIANYSCFNTYSVVFLNIEPYIMHFIFEGAIVLAAGCTFTELLFCQGIITLLIVTSSGRLHSGSHLSCTGVSGGLH